MSWHPFNKNANRKAREKKLDLFKTTSLKQHERNKPIILKYADMILKIKN